MCTSRGLCTVAEDANGERVLAARFDPPRGVYIASGQIARIDLLPQEVTPATVNLAA
jgi:hypothetical protein